MNKIHFIGIFFLVFLFSSCSKENSNHLKVIGVSQCSDDAWRRTMNNEMTREASFYPKIEVRIKTAYDSNQQQIRDIESFIADKVDLIIVAPNEAVPLTPVIEKAMQEGIPVILVDRKINSENYTAFVGADNYQIGREVGVYAVNLLNGKGNVVEIRGLKGSTPDLERHNGFKSILAGYPDIHIVYQADGAWLRKTAREKTTGFLQQKIPVDLIFAHNDEMATGAYEALKQVSGIRKPLLLGIDALPGSDGGIQKVINGVLDATFIYPTGGEKAIQTAVHILNKEPFQKENMLYTAVVDKTNARVIKLQTDQILDHQYRINQLNEVLNRNLEKYSTQRTLLVGSFVVLFLILVMMILLFRAYRSKNRTNKLLESTNIAINRQKEELSQQKDQLMVLSKNLEEATQSKLIFFTNISHEFRTPLTLLHGPLDWLTENETLSNEGLKMTRLMHRNIHILMKLIDQIIEFRRFENGKMQMFFTLGDLKSFLSEIYESFRELARKKHVHFTFSAINEDFTLWFDSDKMEKIVYNLISNALKFTPENGTVKLSLSKSKINGEDAACITVSDTGPGISEQHIHQVFDRFYRVNSRVEGSGIGLAITKMLVEQHNGTIEVESSEGRGTSFMVTMPYSQKNIAATEQYPVLDSSHLRSDDVLVTEGSEEDETKEPSPESKKPLVLLVEDNSDVRTYVRSLLGGEYEILEAINGQQGLLKARKYVPDLIISDVKMDGMDGFELCRTLKDELSTSHIPVILLTAFSMDEQKVVGFESGADAYVTKPFNEEILKIRIRKLIENREKVKEAFRTHFSFGEKKETISEIDKTFMGKFRKIVENNLIDSDLNVDDIGKNLGLSRVQLYRKIKSLTNYAPNELVRIIRLKAAEKLLVSSEKSISEIAYETGFSSPSYFTKCFREYFNESPTNYVNRMKG